MAADSGREPDRDLLIWLKVNVENLLKGQDELKSELKQDIRETNRRIDRLMWGLLVLGGGILGTLITLLVRGG